MILTKRILMKTKLIVALAMAAVPAAALPHSGGTDKYGCHKNHKTGEYHCHKPKTDPKVQ